VEALLEADPNEWSVCIKTQKRFFLVFLLSLRQILMNFCYATFDIFSLGLFSLCGIYPRGRSFREKQQKRFFLVFLLSVEALLTLPLLLTFPSLLTSPLITSPLSVIQPSIQYLLTVTV
jgi:hypothetical protein